jgi:prepilin peptidase CpaA
MVVVVIAGAWDWRSRRIPNWLTVSGAAAGVVVNTILAGWVGLKTALLGILLGLAVFLPFVLIRSLGAGDWKLTGALGAALGSQQLGSVLVASLLVAGVMALAVVIWTGRLKQTLVNIVRILGSLVSLHMPPPDVSLDDPNAAKIPFGVAMSAAVVLIGLGRLLGKL